MRWDKLTPPGPVRLLPADPMAAIDVRFLARFFDLRGKVNAGMASTLEVLVGQLVASPIARCGFAVRLEWRALGFALGVAVISNVAITRLHGRQTWASASLLGGVLVLDTALLTLLLAASGGSMNPFTAAAPRPPARRRGITTSVGPFPRMVRTSIVLPPLRAATTSRSRRLRQHEQASRGLRVRAMKSRALFVVTLVGCAGHGTPSPPTRSTPATPPPAVATPVRSPIEPPPPAPIDAAVVQPAPLSVAWAKVAESSPNFIDAVAVRADGSILVTGDDDGRGWLAKPRRGQPTGSAVVSLSATGTTQWVRALGNAELHAVAALPDGGAIACGHVTGTLKVDGKPRAKATGERDVLVVALDPAGKVTWVFTARSAQAGTCNDVALTAEGDIVIVGAVVGEARFGELPTHAFGDSDVFVAKLDAGGAPQWVATGGSRAYDDARSVAVAGTAIYVTGQFGGAATFGATQLALAVGAASKVANPSNVYVERFGPNGDLAWATSYGVAESFDQGWGITGLTDGGAAVVGQMGGHAFVARYAPSGRQLWAHAASNDSVARAVVALPDDELIVAAYWGWPQGGHELSLVGATRTITLTAEGSDTALARYSARGELLAAARIAGATPHHPDDRDGSEAEISDLARTTSGRLVLAGRLWGSARFEAGSLLRPTGLRVTVPGERGSLLVALDPAP